MTSLMDTRDTERRIAERVSPETAQNMSVAGIGTVDFAQLMEFAKLMSISQVAVRKHLRGNPGACLAVAMQAIEWKMSPFQVANKSYAVSDQLAYEASLLHAVVQSRAPIKGRVKAVYQGVGPTRRCRVYGELSDGSGETVDYESPEFKDINPKNSPLWKNDPDQQLFYFSVRSWCRRHFPDIILGVYAHDEIIDAEPMRNERASSGLKDRLLASPSAPTGFSKEHIDRETGEVTQAHTEAVQPAEVIATTSDAAAPPSAEEAPQDYRKQYISDIAYHAGYDAYRGGKNIASMPAEYLNDSVLIEAFTDGFKMAEAETA